MPDSLIENHVQRIEKNAADFFVALDVLDAEQSHASLMRVCQCVNNTRLEIGNLSFLDPEHNVRVEKALTDFLHRADVLLGLAPPMRKWIRRAIASVAKSLVELEPIDT